MWNQYQTDEYQGMLAETITVEGHNGDQIHAYFARPLGSGPYPGVVLIPHMPGWDEFYRETTRRFAQHGYAAICPDIYCRVGYGTPDEIAKKSREAGGLPDDQVMGDCQKSVDFLKSRQYSNQKVGVIGTCSGGRHSFLAACKVNGIDAAVDCWGGAISSPGGITPSQPVPPIEYVADMSCPLLGIFGNDDKFPSPEEVNQIEEILKQHNKEYEFHRYDGAGHAFWSYHSEAYRPKQTMDSWNEVFKFFGKYLS